MTRIVNEDRRGGVWRPVLCGKSPSRHIFVHRRRQPHRYRSRYLMAYLGRYLVVAVLSRVWRRAGQRQQCSWPSSPTTPDWPMRSDATPRAGRK
jgi:hypothetical protein